MNIGIATVYNSENCGSFMQAYALFNILKSKGHNPYFIESIDWFSSSTGMFPGRLINLCKQLLRFNFSSALYLHKRHKLFKKDLDYTKGYVCSINKINTLDKCIVGSDTIWNIEDIYCRQRSNIYTGEIFKIPFFFYAASSGNVTYTDVLKRGVDFSSISKAKGISVRDTVSQQLVENIIGLSPHIVLDPTIIVDTETFDAFDIMEVPNRYMVVYCFGRISKTVQEQIKSYAKTNGLNIISFGCKYTCTDIIVPNAPSYFISYFKHATAIVTNTFHGTVFSVIYQKEFAVITNEKSKINDFVHRVGLNDRIMKNEDLLFVLKKNISYDDVNKALNETKQVSIEYLESMIK